MIYLRCNTLYDVIIIHSFQVRFAQLPIIVNNHDLLKMLATGILAQFFTGLSDLRRTNENKMWCLWNKIKCKSM